MKQAPMLTALLFCIVVFSCSDERTQSGDNGGNNDSPSMKKKTQLQDSITGQYVVLLKESIAPPIIAGKTSLKDRLQNYKNTQAQRTRNAMITNHVIQSHKIKSSNVKLYYSDIVVGFTAVLSKNEVDSLKSDPHVKGVYQDYFVKFIQGPFLSIFEVGELKNELQSCVEMTGGPGNGEGKDTWIWIVDTGIDLDHHDLNVEKDEPYVFDTGGGSGEDDNGHGTMVAGLAAAKQNGFGICGVSAGATVVPVKIGSHWGTRYGTSLGAILSALNHIFPLSIEDDVVNMSLSLLESDDCGTGTIALLEELKMAIAILGARGVWVCMGSGNDALCDGANRSVPACINGIRILTVGGISPDGSCLEMSNFGPGVDWVAPGRGCISTFLDGKYSAADGTSMSTPLVSGIIHARRAAPVSSGTINCCGRDYRKAHLTLLSTTKFDVDLILEGFEFKKISDLDGTEDLFGRIDFKGMRVGDGSFSDDVNLFSREANEALHHTVGDFAIDKRIKVAEGLSYNELRNIELRVGGRLDDEEGLLHPRHFICRECDNDLDGFGTRVVKFIESFITLASINELEMDSEFQTIKFGNGNTFELNFVENGRSNDGQVKVLFKVQVRPRGLVNPACSACHRSQSLILPQLQ